MRNSIFTEQIVKYMTRLSRRDRGEKFKKVTTFIKLQVKRRNFYHIKEQMR